MRLYIIKGSHYILKKGVIHTSSELCCLYIIIESNRIYENLVNKNTVIWVFISSQKYKYIDVNPSVIQPYP